MVKQWLIIFVLLSPFIGFCQELILNVSHNPVEVGQQFRIDFIIEGNASDFKGPNLTGLRKVSGPNQSSSSSMQIINGKVSRSNTTTYSYYVTALNEGELVIGQASVKYDGKIVRSKAGQIQVLKASQKTKSNTYNISENVFIKATANNKSLYQGQQLVVSYKLYSKINLADIKLSELPDLNGFWKEDIETNSGPKLEVIDGVNYNVWEISRFILTPQKSGSLTIDPMKINITVQIKKNRSRDPFGDPFGFFGSYQNIEEELSSKSITINVKDLPPGAPESFNGAVGQFELKSSINKTNVETNQAINYTLTLSGNGNIKLIDKIPVEFSSNFDAFDPQKKDKTFTTNNGIAGKLEFEHLLIPRYKGNYTIEGVEFSYFNPKTKRYNTITTQEHSINVLKGQEKSNDYLSAEELNEFNQKEFSDIFSHSKLKKNQDKTINFWLILILVTIPIAGLIVFLIARLIQAKNNANPVLKRYRKSLIYAEKRLKNARNHLKNNQKSLFFEEIEKSLWLYFSNKFNVSTADLSKDTINHYFNKNNITESVSTHFTNIIQKCEFCRFAPSSLDSEDMDDVYQKATKVIIEVEQDLKK